MIPRWRQLTRRTRRRLWWGLVWILVPLVLAGVTVPLALILNAKPVRVSTQPSSSRSDILLDHGGWRFHRGDVPGAQDPGFDDADWKPVSLPHTWNSRDGQDGGANYYRGIGWYRVRYTVDPAQAGRRLYLQFDGANLVTEVYVNGVFLGRHLGGYATFRFDATEAFRPGPGNVIAVKVDNGSDKDVPPLTGDYTFFGGLYRDVHLITTNPVHVDLLDHGSPGVYLAQSDVTAESAGLTVTVEARNDDDTSHPVTVDTALLDAAGQVVQRLIRTEAVSTHSGLDIVQRTTVTHPRLWDGQRSPYLYHVEVAIRLGTRVTDIVSQPLGFRSYRVDATTGFTLNDHHADLHGVNLHQDRLDEGWAVTDAQLDQDFGFAVEIGATAVRMAHYPHAQHIYDLADRQGMVIWAEIPLINNITDSPAFAANTENQLRELIRQNYNHPSILFWGIGNEIHHYPDPNTLLDELNALAHREDPGRITTIAMCCLSETDPIALHSDTRGYNQYLGWYTGKATDVDAWATTLHAKNPGLSFAVSEYGAGGSIHQHEATPATTPPVGYFHPEEYQSYLHEVSWEALRDKPYIWGTFVWQLFDTASDARDEGDTAGRNDKGLVTYDRQTRKDAFYWYKANWSSSPFVYVTSRRYTHRTAPTTDVKVYANTESVSLTVNGVSLGTKVSGDHIFQWTGVSLQPGNNTVEAHGVSAGTTYSDTVTWTYSPNVDIAAGARMPYTDPEGTYYDADHDVVGGTPGMAHDTAYRSGTFTYTIPVVPGRYTLTLGFVEPTVTAAGRRVFSVSANGRVLVGDLDVFRRAGKDNPVRLSFPVDVPAGTLTLSFTPVVGQPILSTIDAVRQ